MSKLWLIGLAASAAWTPAAIAQGAPPPPPPPPMAHGAHAPGHGAGHHAMPPVMHGGGHSKGGGHMGGHLKGGGHMKGMPGHMGGHVKGIPGAGHMKRWQRFGRGHVIPPHFRSPQFFVHDWRSFGWPAPMPGGSWIRHYDDALLIDGDGRVVDSRYGWDWGGRGHSMAYGDGGYDEGYADEDGYEDDHGGGDAYGGYEEGHAGGRHGKGDRVVRVYRHGEGGDGDWDGCRRGCAPMGHLPPPHPGYGYGYGMGYGYGYGAVGPVVVTETITTTAPVMETHTYYETVTEHGSAPRRHYKKPARHYSKPAVRRSVKPAYRAPAPRPGERG